MGETFLMADGPGGLACWLALPCLACEFHALDGAEVLYGAQCTVLDRIDRLGPARLVGRFFVGVVLTGCVNVVCNIG